VALRCDYGQGFLFSRPLAPEPLDQLLLQDLRVPAPLEPTGTD
jgi:EAL domain-containing protein (putative c-di-GMP-specific phosphodiesterase class I)